MKQTFAHLLAAAVAALAAFAAAGSLQARDTNALSSMTNNHSGNAAGADTGLLDLTAFRLISERNIFNPNRSGRGDERTTRREPERRVRTDSFALLGTMSYEKGRFAFFDGSSSDYRKVLQATNEIAGFKITAVAPTCVKLETTNGQNIELCVGMQMSKREDEDWRLHDRVGSSSSSSSDSSSGTASAEPSDVLKRMMERRQSEGAVEAPAAAAAPAAEQKEASSNSASEPDEVIRRLLQKREQELNK